MVSWTPYACVALLGISGNQDKLTADMTMLPALLAKFSACVNPIVYTLSHPKIKKEILRRWYCVMSSGQRNCAGEASADGICLSAGRQGRVWRQGSASRSKSNTGSASPKENYKNRPNIVVNQIAQADEPTPSHNQLGSMVDNPLHLRSHSNTPVETNTNFVDNTDKRIGLDDETCPPNATLLIIAADVNNIEFPIDNCRSQNSNRRFGSDSSTGLMVDTTNSQTRKNEEEISISFQNI